MDIHVAQYRQGPLVIVVVPQKAKIRKSRKRRTELRGSLSPPEINDVCGVNRHAGSIKIEIYIIKYQFGDILNGFLILVRLAPKIR